MNDMKPILFNTEMVRAILEGRKTVTRRVVKPQPIWDECWMLWWWKWHTFWWRDGWDPMETFTEKYSIFKTGDILYVRERVAYLFGRYAYRADYDEVTEESKPLWKTSTNMPREAARLFLRVTSVRVERLQDCGNTQAKDEGCTCCSQFARVWDSTIKKADLPRYGWEANPWVWVIEFERIGREDVR